MRYAISVKQPAGHWALRSHDGELEAESSDHFLAKAPIQSLIKRLDKWGDTWRVVLVPSDDKTPVSVVYTPPNRR